jgi:benzoylformate decarboxylase
VNGAEAFVATLRAWGVDTFFGLPGSTEAPLLEALREDGGIRYVLALHEGVAVSLADGYARASGRPGVVGLHTTVGTMNGMSQLFNSSRDGVPVVMTAGHKDRVVLAEDGFCAFPDLASLLRSFTKSAWQSLTPDQVAADLSRALLAATTSPKGPVYLAVPEDLQTAQLTTPLARELLPSLGQRSGTPEPDPADLAAVAARLRAARKPVLVLGTEAASASKVAAELADEVGLLVLAADLIDLAAFSYPASDRHYLGVYGDDPAILQGCDLVLAVGGRVFYPFSNRLRPHLPAGAALVHIHPDPTQLGRRIATEIGVVGEPQAALAGLLRECRAIPDASARAERERTVDRLREVRSASIAQEVALTGDEQPAAVAAVLSELSQILPAGTLLVDEAVRASRAVFRHCGVPKSGEIWRSTGGSLGWGLPAAIGAKLARPDRPVVLLVGDGSLHFSVQALWTAVAQNAPVVVVVLDNGGYLAVKRAIENMLSLPHDPRLHPGTELPGIDHLAAARAYGAHGVLAHTPQEVAAAVEQGLAQNRVEVVSVPVAQIRP